MLALPGLPFSYRRLQAIQSLHSLQNSIGPRLTDLICSKIGGAKEKMGVFDPPSIRAKIAQSIRHIIPVPTMLQTQKNSSENVVKCACLLLYVTPPLFAREEEGSIFAIFSKKSSNLQ